MDINKYKSTTDLLKELQKLANFILTYNHWYNHEGELRIRIEIRFGDPYFNAFGLELGREEITYRLKSKQSLCDMSIKALQSNPIQYCKNYTIRALIHRPEFREFIGMLYINKIDQ